MDSVSGRASALPAGYLRSRNRRSRSQARFAQPSKSRARERSQRRDWREREPFPRFAHPAWARPRSPRTGIRRGWRPATRGWTGARLSGSPRDRSPRRSSRPAQVPGRCGRRCHRPRLRYGAVGRPRTKRGCGRFRSMSGRRLWGPARSALPRAVAQSWRHEDPECKPYSRKKTMPRRGPHALIGAPHLQNLSNSPRTNQIEQRSGAIVKAVPRNRTPKADRPLPPTIEGG